jgi:hypothetical protein
MRAAGELSDITLIFGDTRFPCHKFQLATSSEYFRAMFNSGLKEGSAPEVFIRNIDEFTAEVIVKYLYSGDLDINEANAQELLAAADMFLLHQAIEQIEQFLLERISPINCVEMINLSKLYHLRELERDSTQFICHNLKAAAEDEGFVTLAEEDFENILKNTDVMAGNEEKFVAIQKWVQRLKKRKPKFAKLLNYVSFSSMSKDFLCNVVMLDENLRSNESCLQRFQNAMRLHMVPERVDYVLTVADYKGNVLQLREQKWETLLCCPAGHL